MKIRLLFLLLVLSQFTFGQMTIDLGNDTVFCFPPDTSQINYTLGSNLLINQGTPPYVYQWSIAEPYSIPFSSITLNSSDFMSDTTIASPNLIDGPGVLDSIEFFLLVTDATGSQSKDSVTVFLSQFVQGTDFVNVYLTAGDTFHFNFPLQVSGGLGDLQILWRPNQGLIDSTSEYFYAAPQNNIIYYNIVTDTAGCEYTAAPLYYVYVGYLAVAELLKSKSSITLFPNPTKGVIQLKDEENITKNIQIYDANSRFVAEVLSSNFPYDLSSYAKGTYFLKIETEGESVTKTVVLE